MKLLTKQKANWQIGRRGPARLSCASYRGPKSWAVSSELDIRSLAVNTFSLCNYKYLQQIQPHLSSGVFGDHMADIGDWAHALLNPSPLGLIITIFLAISIPIFLHSVVFRASGLTTLPSILLIGPSGSGKTSLLTLVSSPRSTSVPEVTGA